MSTLHQLEEKIYSLVPELKELTFGCEFERYGNRYVYLDARHAMINGEVKKTAYTEISELSKTIIGHEIHLEHIMKVLGNGWAFSRVPTGYILLKMASNGSYYKYWHGDDNKGTFIVYEDKSFKDQSPEFHQFLLENIK